MKISEIRKTAARCVFQQEVEKAKELLEIYEKYKPMLKAEKKIRAWFEKHKNAYSLICVHGDLNNMWVCEHEKNYRNLTGEVTEEIDSNIVQFGCMKHDDSDVVRIDEFCEAVAEIDEFDALREFLAVRA